MKKIITVFLKGFMAILLFLTSSDSGLSLSVSAEEKAGSDDGYAYAVCTITDQSTNRGDLIFFRSRNDYTADAQWQTVTDIYGNTYEGFLYAKGDDIEGERCEYPDGKAPWFGSRNSILRVYAAENQTIKIRNMNGWFFSFKQLVQFDSTGFDTSECSSFENLFYDCEKLESADLSHFDTSAAANMSGMFWRCKGLKELDLSSFNTAVCKDVTQMFYNCSALEKLDLSSFNTQNMSGQMSGLFAYDTSLFEVKLGSGFTVWTNDAYLPEGLWTNGTVTRTEKSLYEEYPSHASQWAGTWTNNGTAVHVQGISISKTSLTLKKGQSETLIATVLPENATDQTCTWASSDSLIADVQQSGKVTARKAGKAVISVTSNDGGFTAECAVTVIDEGGELSLDGTAYALLDQNGTLLFFRSYNTYSNNTSVTAEDIFSNTYEGTVYSGIEDLNFNVKRAWDSQDDNITDVTSAEGQAIQPATMKDWFSSMKNLQSADLSHFDTSETTDMSGLFSWCYALTAADVSGFDTGNTEDMSLMFASCSSLTALDVSNFRTDWVSDMHSMFNGCQKLSSIDVSGFDTGNVTDMSGMFNGCSELTELDLRNFRTDKVTDMSYMFGSCSNLTSLDLSSFRTGNVTDMQTMFCNCTNLTSLDLSGFDVSKVTDMFSMFRQCYKLENLILSSFRTGNATKMNYMFTDCIGLTSLDVSSFETGSVTDMSYMFSGCTSLKTLKGTNFDTRNVTTMRYMFYNCNSLESLDAGSFDTRNVTDIYYMFYNCGSLKTLNIESFNTSKITDMSYMFCSCYSLTELDVSMLDTQNVTDMSSMFESCSSLKSLDLSNFNTSNVKNMKVMFNNCRSLTSLDLSSFNTENVVNMYRMFGSCNSLLYLDLSSFNTSKVSNMNYLFDKSDLIETVKLGAGFTKWSGDYARLPSGTWVNKEKGLSADENELYSQYPSHASEWAGTWTRRYNSYAVLSGSNLIFFQSQHDYSGVSYTTVTDINGNKYTGYVYSNFENSSFEEMDIPWWNVIYQIKTIDVADGQTIRPVSMANWFKNCSNLVSADLRGFETGQTTDMSNLFYLCINMETLNIQGLDTGNVTDMNNMFNQCLKLTELDISGFNTEKVTDLSGMFYNCYRLTELDTSGFKTTNAANMKEMFCGCMGLESLDLSGFDTSSVTSMEDMFSSCYFTTVKLGNKFTKWIDNARIPEGTWTNQAAGLSKTAAELYEQYPSHASSWAGTWTKGSGTVSVTGISLNKNSAKLAADETLQLTAEITPSNATNKNVKWTVNNNIATVDSSGKVTMGRSYGKAVITAETEDGGFKDTCTIQMLFKDVTDEGKYYYKPVYWAADKAITKGYPAEGTFKPQANCTREAVVTFLWRLAGQPKPKNTNSPFKDVQDKSKYYYNAVLWAAEKGITKGYDDGSFRPDDTCLREHVVTFLWRYAGKPKVSASNQFTDVKTSDYYYMPVLWAAKNNITKGYADDNYKTFRPKLDCLREHVVTFLYRYAHSS